MATPTVDEILDMKSYELKEFLQNHHVPVPKRQSKEFLQSAALQTHADLEAETSKRRIMTRRRSKREETDQSSSYSDIHGRFASRSRSSPTRSSSSSSSSPSPHSTMTTRTKSNAYNIKSELHSPGVTKPEHEAEELITHRHDQEEEVSRSSYPAILLHGTPPASTTPPPFNLMSSDFNQQLEKNGGDREAAPSSASASEQAHEEISGMEGTESLGAAIRDYEESAEKREEDEGSIKQSVIRASDEEAQKKQASGRSNQKSVIGNIIREDDEAAADHQDRINKGSSWIKKRLIPQAQPAGGRTEHELGQRSRLQKLKRSGSSIMSQVNDRVFKRIRRRTSSHISIALLVCAAICITAMGATSYWYLHLRKMEEERARKRWLMW